MKTISRTPLLIAMAGLPATGKSTIAAVLARRLDALILNKDSIRERIFSREKIDYSQEQDDLCMEVMFVIAGYVLQAQRVQSVIVDGRTFSRSYQVAQLQSRAESFGAKPVIIECICDDAIAKQRLEDDLRTGAHPAGNRTYDLYLELKEQAESITADRLVIDTGRESIETSVDRCLAYLGGQKK